MSTQTSLRETLRQLGPDELERVSRAAGHRLAGRAPQSIPPRTSSRAPLSCAQQGLWYVAQLAPDSPAYSTSSVLRLHGVLDVAALRGSVTALVRRHEVLRTAFQSADGQPWQAVQAASRVSVPVVDLTMVPAGSRERMTRGVASAEAERPFDVTRPPLVRVRVVRLSDVEHAVLVTQHHLVSDGWSVNVLVRELRVLYEAAVAGTPAALPRLRIQYADYAAWQRKWLTGAAAAASLAYWTRQLADAPARLSLPVDRPRPAVPSYRGVALHLDMAGDLAARVRALARAEQATPFVLLVAALGILLSRYSGQRDVVLGTPVVSRSRTDLEGLIGCFTNALALRVRHATGITFRELIRQVRETTLDAFTHRDLPFEFLLDALSIERTLSHNPVFQVMVAMQNAHHRPVGMSTAGLRIETATAPRHTAKFDLELMVTESSSGFHVVWEYARDLFDSTTVSGLARGLTTVLEEMVARPEARVGDLALVRGAERARMVRAWNDTAAAVPPGSVYEWFASQAARVPERVAARDAERSVSYAELLDRAERIAAGLMNRHGVGVEHVVGILMPRGVEFLATVLGVLRTGAAYLPISPDEPPARQRAMLHDSGARVVVVGSADETAAGPAAEVVTELAAGGGLTGAGRQCRRSSWPM